MCCILFKWNKLRPLLQVAKLSVYNLSNKHVFYSGFLLCCLYHQKWHKDTIMSRTVQWYMCRVMRAVSSLPPQDELINMKFFEHNEACGQRLATVGFWLSEPDSCSTGQSERHHSISSHGLVIEEFVATSLTLNLSCSTCIRPSSCTWVCLCYLLYVMFRLGL